MLRRLFRVFSAISLLLCAATCVLWMQSYSANLNKPFQFRFQGRSWEINWLNGSFVLDDQPQSDLELAEVTRLQEQANRAAERLDDAELKLREMDGAGLPSQSEKDTVAEMSRVLKSIELKIGNVAGTQPGSIPILMVSDYSFSMRAAATAFGALPILWIVSATRSRLRRSALRAGFRCPSCGYDLRATPDPQAQYHLKYSG